MALTLEEQRKRALSLVDFVSGGLLSDCWVRFERCYCRIADYQGKSDQETTALHIDMQVCDENGVPDESEQLQTNFWSIGPAEHVQPSEDERFVYQAEHSRRQSLYHGSNAEVFIKSLIKHGVDEHRIKADASQLDGTVAFVTRVPANRRDDDIGKRADGRPAEVLIVSPDDKSVKWFGYEKQGKKGSRGASKAKAKKDNAAELFPKAVVAALAEGDDIDTSTLALRVNQWATKNAKSAQKELMKMAMDEDAIGGVEGVTVEDGQVKLEA